MGKPKHNLSISYILCRFVGGHQMEWWWIGWAPHRAPTSWATRNHEATAPAGFRTQSNQDIPRSEKSLETPSFLNNFQLLLPKSVKYSTTRFPKSTQFHFKCHFFARFIVSVSPAHQQKKHIQHQLHSLHRTSRRARRCRETVTYQLFGILAQWKQGTDLGKFIGFHHGKWGSQKMMIKINLPPVILCDAGKWR